MSPAALRRRDLVGAAVVTVALVAGLGPATAASAQRSRLPRTPVALTAPAVRPAPTAAELAELRREATVALDEAERASADVLQAASQAVYLRRQLEAIAERRESAQAGVRSRVRQLWMRGRPDPVSSLVLGLGAPDLYGWVQARSGGSDREVTARLEAEEKATAALAAQAEDFRRAQLRRSAPVFAALERAQQLLAQAETAVADAQAKAALAAQRARLAALSQQVSFAVTPAVTARGRRAAAAEAPVIAHLEAHCCDQLPPGYRSTGQTISGIASWYGPGFVGNPTATGAPYDPERLTAAMLAVPLGTVVRVIGPDGRSVNVLVDDRGPYVDGRVIDLSRAGSRILGFDGLLEVTVEVLEPIPS